MRTIRSTFVLLVTFATVALLAASASAGPGPVRPSIANRETPTPLPASALVLKTAAMLPGADYPWVQPHFVRVGGVTLATLPHVIRRSPTTRPPASTRLG